jgi:hypothetical protein
MGIKCTNIFLSETLQNLTELGFLLENMPSGNPAVSRYWKAMINGRRSWAGQPVWTNCCFCFLWANYAHLVYITAVSYILWPLGKLHSGDLVYFFTCLYTYCIKKNMETLGWATFWAIFSQTHRVTLALGSVRWHSFSGTITCCDFSHPYVTNSLSADYR